MGIRFIFLSLDLKYILLLFLEKTYSLIFYI